MNDSLRDRLAARRVKPGDGRPLRRFRWWQMLRRSLFHIDLPFGGGPASTYSVDVWLWGDDNGEVKAHLYVDGLLHSESKVPARLPVPGGWIDTRVTTFGVKRCHFVSQDGSERQLTPDPRSAEGRRARFERNHPAASTVVGVVSIVLLLVGVVLNVLQLLEPLSEIPPINAITGTFVSPIHLPVWLNITLIVGAAIGSTERALRLRYSWIDSFAN